MCNIKGKIKEVNDFFVYKILNGEYVVEKIDTATVTINIDDFIFCLWSINGHYHFETYANEYNFMALQFTDEQKQYLYPVFNKMVTDYIKFTEIEQYNNLKNKYKNTL